MRPNRLGAADVDCAVRDEALCGESPMWSAAEQALYWTDNLGGRISRLDAVSGHLRRIALPESAMDIGLRERGGLVLALTKKLAFCDPGDGRLDVFAKVEDDRPGNRFNDGKVDRRGRYWGGTMHDTHWDRPSGALYRLDTALNVDRVHDDVKCANGLGWSPDDRTFYFGESFRHAIFAYDFDLETGGLSRRRVLATVDEGGAIPDGLTVDAEGGVWSVHNGAGRVVRYAPDGEVTHEIRMPVPQPTSCIFGGRDLDVLYVTTSRQGMAADALRRFPLSGSVLCARPGTVGLPEPAFAG